MMAYRALYRQWRPKDFSHVVGQKPIMDTLRNQVVSGRIAHAYLFCGSRGTGKTSTAKILARAVNCENPQNGDPCGVCPNCLRMENDESLDVIEIDAASNNGVDEMRDLRETVKYPPQFGKYKIYIIDEVHMLSTSAFNALLKTLEEPPAHIVFILATTEPQKLPETILSRCQRFDFGRISVTDIMGRLREAAEGSGAKVTGGALMAIARAAEGGMRDALSILDMCLGYGNDITEEMVRNILGTCDQSFLFDFADAFAREDANALFQMIDQVIRNGRDPVVFIRDVAYHVRVLLLAKCCPEEMETILDLTPEDTEEFRKQAEAFTVTRLMKILDLFMKAESEMRYYSSPRLALENVSLKCCIRTSEPDTVAINDRISDLERKLEELAARPAAVPAVLPAEKAEKEKTSAEKKQKPAAEDKPETKPEAAPAKKNLQAAWKTMMDRFAKEQPATWSMLSQGTILPTEGSTVQWMPKRKEGSEFFLVPLNREDKKRAITDCLKELTGMDYSFEAIPVSEAPSSTNNSDEAYLSRLYETFGKEPVDIV